MPRRLALAVFLAAVLAAAGPLASRQERPAPSESGYCDAVDADPDSPPNDRLFASVFDPTSPFFQASFVDENGQAVFTRFDPEAGIKVDLPVPNSRLSKSPRDPVETLATFYDLNIGSVIKQYGGIKGVDGSRENNRELAKLGKQAFFHDDCLVPFIFVVGRPLTFFFFFVPFSLQCSFERVPKAGREPRSSNQ
jgi:hypothetical protein